MKKTAVSIVLIAVVFSCEPNSKEQYMSDYKRFIDNVSANYKSYTSDDWKKADETFAKFNNEWYNKFKDQFSLEDKVRVTGYQVKYNALKAAKEIGNFYNLNMKEDVEKLRDKIKYYVDNHMERDLDSLLQEAKKVSNEVYEEIKRMANEMKSKKNEK